MNQHITKIANHNGIYVIKDKLIEELNELLAGLEANDDVNIIEELADVSIMIAQYIHKKEINTEVVEQINKKINRTLKRYDIK